MAAKSLKIVGTKIVFLLGEGGRWKEDVRDSNLEF
jgi:hypothetical protein